MGDLAESFNAIREYNAQKKDSLEPSRFEYAKSKLENIGATIKSKNDGSRSMVVNYKDLKITFYPYTGWATGKGIKDGRGINNLVKQLKVYNAKN